MTFNRVRARWVFTRAKWKRCTMRKLSLLFAQPAASLHSETATVALTQCASDNWKKSQRCMPKRSSLKKLTVKSLSKLSRTNLHHLELVMVVVRGKKTGLLFWLILTHPGFPRQKGSKIGASKISLRCSHQSQSMLESFSVKSSHGFQSQLSHSHLILKANSIL